MLRYSKDNDDDDTASLKKQQARTTYNESDAIRVSDRNILIISGNRFQVGCQRGRVIRHICMCHTAQTNFTIWYYHH